VCLPAGPCSLYLSTLAVLKMKRISILAVAAVLLSLAAQGAATARAWLSHLSRSRSVTSCGTTCAPAPCASLRNVACPFCHESRFPWARAQQAPCNLLDALCSTAAVLQAWPCLLASWPEATSYTAHHLLQVLPSRLLMLPRATPWWMALAPTSACCPGIWTGAAPW
jgi:hypothetical protein